MRCLVITIQCGVITLALLDLKKTGAINETVLIDQDHSYSYPDEMLNTGGGASHSHGDTGNQTVTTSTMSPYITTYFWKRKS